MSITAVAAAVAPAPRSSEVSAAEVRRLARSLSASVARVDNEIGSLDGREAAGLATAFAEVERLAAAGKTLAAGRVASSGSYRELGFTTGARWLAAATGEGSGDAARVLATAAHLGDAELAPTRAAFVGGSLTSVQAAEVARTAAGAPAEQHRLLQVARSETPVRLREECRKVRLAGRPAEDPRDRGKRMAEEMAFSTRDLGDGLSELFTRMPTSWMVRVLAAVRHQREAVFARARAEGRTDPQAAYLVEALVTLLLFGDLTGSGIDGASAGGDGGGGAPGTDEVDHGGGAGGAGDSAGDEDVDSLIDDPLHDELLAVIRGAPPPAGPARAQRRRRRAGRCACGGRVTPRAKIIVRVDHDALVRGHAVGDETCDIAGVGPVPVATVRELWPDAVVKLVVTRGVDVVHVTHLGRRATEAMVTAMQWRSTRCANIACDNDQFVEIDHRLGFANVHRTRLDELDGLCHHCHDAKSNDDWQLVAGKGRRRFVPPEHPDHPGDPPTPRRRA